MNADYHFDCEDFEIVLELKQISRYRGSRTIDKYFSDRLSEGRMRNFDELSPGRIRIGPSSLSASDWARFYKRVCPAVPEALKKAAKQLKETERFLPLPSKRRLRGAVFLNSGDFNISTDLLIRLVEARLKNEWKSGHLGSIEFVSCVSVDMVHDQQHPLHARHIVRSADDEILVAAVRYLFDRWIHYGAEAVDAAVEFEPGALPEAVPADLNKPFRGKLVFKRAALDKTLSSTK